MDTDAVIMIGKIGGPDEANTAEWIKGNIKKPVVSFIAGATPPAGKRMDHGGALMSGGTDLEIMDACGIKVTKSSSEMARLLIRFVSRIMATPE
jgi:succinyl-CoA synthetase alpha subunit